MKITKIKYSKLGFLASILFCLYSLFTPVVFAAFPGVNGRIAYTNIAIHDETFDIQIALDDFGFNDQQILHTQDGNTAGASGSMRFSADWY